MDPSEADFAGANQPISGVSLPSINNGLRPSSAGGNAISGWMETQGAANASGSTWGATNETAAERGLYFIRRQIEDHRMAVSSLFESYDKLRRGVVTGAQFMSALGSVRWPHGNLDAAQLEGLARRYATADVDVDVSTSVFELRASGQNAKPGLLAQHIDYKAFIRDVDPVAAAGSLERNPAGSVQRLVPSTLALRRAGPNAAAVNEAFVVATLEKVKFIVSTRRLLLKPTLVDLDAAGTSLTQTRVITVPRFQRALATCGVTLAADELSAVCFAFATTDTPPRVDYVRFLEHIDTDGNDAAASTAAASPSAARSPSVRPGGVGGSTWSIGGRGGSTAVVAAPTGEEVVARLARDAFVRGLRPCEYFRDRDRRGTGFVSPGVVAPTLSQAGCTVTAADVEALIAAYEDRTTKRFKWAAMEKDILAASAQLQQARLAASAAPAADEAGGTAVGAGPSAVFDLNGPTVGPKVYRGGPTIGVTTPLDAVLHEDVGELLYELRSRCTRQGSHPGAVFADHDPLRRGIIHTGAFQAAFARGGLRLDDTQLQLLSDAFACDDPPQHVRYKDFLAALEDGWIPSQLERHPLTTPIKFSPRPRHTADSAAAVALATKSVPVGESTAASSVAAEVVQHVARQVSARRVELLQFFRDHDRLRRCRLSPAQFATVLGNAGLALRPSRAEDRVGDLQHLISVFSDPRGDIEYLRSVPRLPSHSHHGPPLSLSSPHELLSLSFVPQSSPAPAHHSFLDVLERA